MASIALADRQRDELIVKDLMASINDRKVRRMEEAVVGLPKAEKATNDIDEDTAVAEKTIQVKPPPKKEQQNKALEEANDQSQTAPIDIKKGTARQAKLPEARKEKSVNDQEAKAAEDKTAKVTPLVDAVAQGAADIKDEPLKAKSIQTAADKKKATIDVQKAVKANIELLAHEERKFATLLRELEDGINSLSEEDQAEAFQDIEMEVMEIAIKSLEQRLGEMEASKLLKP